MQIYALFLQTDERLIFDISAIPVTEILICTFTEARGFTVASVFTPKPAIPRQKAAFRQQEAPDEQQEPLNFCPEPLNFRPEPPVDRPEPPVDRPEPAISGAESAESATCFCLLYSRLRV